METGSCVEFVAQNVEKAGSPGTCVRGRSARRSVVAWELWCLGLYMVL